MPNRPKVVVVDDSDIVLGWVESALEDECDVVGLSSAVDVAATVFREKPDLVLLDVKMPVLRGDHIVSLARESAGDKAMGVVLFSGMPVDELASKAAACGADGYIQKSGDVEIFVDQVRTFISPGAPHPQVRSAPRAGSAERHDRKTLLVGGGSVWPSSELEALHKVFNIASHSRGDEVVQSLQVERPALVMLGPDLDDMSAAELCRRVRVAKRAMQVSMLFVGNAADAARAAELEAAGANAVLLRPFEPTQLLDLVGRLANIAVRRTTRLMVRMEDGGMQGEGFQVGFTRNLSSSGMLVESSLELAVGTRLKLSFFLPGASHEVSTEGEVVRVQQPGGDKRLLGLKFIALAVEARSAIERFVEEAR